MKYAIAFIVAFAVVAAGAALVRVSLTGEREHSPASNDEAPTHDAHADHNDHADPNDHADHADVELDLRNAHDPVSGAAIGDDHSAHAHAVFHGFQIHFESDDTSRRFTRRPDRFMQKLELERTLNGEIIKVNTAEYRTPKLPVECPFCGMEIKPEDDIYILHRGFKIYFGCWGGCDQEFLEDPKSHYAAYGLEERDGKLVLQ